MAQDTNFLQAHIVLHIAAQCWLQGTAACHYIWVEDGISSTVTDT